MNLIKKIFSNLNKKRLSDDGSRQRLLKSISESLNCDILNPNTRICIAHNIFEKGPLNSARTNLHDTYISLEDTTNSYIIHFDQMSVLNLVEKDYIEYQNKQENFDIKSIEQDAISLIIKTSIEHLKSITPKTSLNEDKSLEWLKVTLLTLKKSVQKIDHENTILSYKVFFGAWEENPILRIMIYNLDIKLIFTPDQLKLIVRNKENRDSFDAQAKVYEAQFGQAHNEVLNELINLFIKLREVIS